MTDQPTPCATCTPGGDDVRVLRSVPDPPPARVFPLRPVPQDDPRFTFGLTFEVAKVLAQHGYPDIATPQADGRDFVELQQALHRFLYRGEDR